MKIRSSAVMPSCCNTLESPLHVEDVVSTVIHVCSEICNTCPSRMSDMITFPNQLTTSSVSSTCVVLQLVSALT